jgi:hypothetical protein
VPYGTIPASSLFSDPHDRDLIWVVETSGKESQYKISTNTQSDVHPGQSGIWDLSCNRPSIFIPTTKKGAFLLLGRKTWLFDVETGQWSQKLWVVPQDASAAFDLVKGVLWVQAAKESVFRSVNLI